MSRIEIIRGDITAQEVDAIVNAANSSLLGGGGVDGAIHRAAGPGLLAECRALGGCQTGEAKITAGHALPARYVIHTVGPVWRGGTYGEADLLASCYRSSLDLARENNCTQVAFPAISCGVYGYPLKEAARASLDAVRDYLRSQTIPRLVRWVMFDADAFDAWMARFSTEDS
jgi:O-acetyl-ADP-ribose deacetylase (regulator of RNase III)